jgi:nucleotide-binding universal stress UspA family protein
MVNAPWARILVGTDFSDPARAAFGTALDLAKALGATVEVVHVRTPLGDMETAGILPGPEREREVEDEIDRGLTAFRDQALAAGVACITSSLEGTPQDCIIERAKQIGAKLIVVGTHGRTGLSHLVLGSVAERIVQHASVPVVVIPRGGRAE